MFAVCGVDVGKAKGRLEAYHTVAHWWVLGIIVTAAHNTQRKVNINVCIYKQWELR